MRKHNTVSSLSLFGAVGLVLGLAMVGTPALGDEIFLTPDLANSTTAYHGSSVALTLNDAFAYDVANPTTPMPKTSWPGGWHGGGSGTQVIAYKFDETYDTVTIDIYGRTGCCQERDDDFDVVLYRGTVPVETIAAVGIPDGATPHLRVTAKAITAADGMRLVCDNNINFTIMEVRANGSLGTPPTVFAIEGGLTLLGLALLGYLLIRRR